jgi:hypothetical protein
MRNCDAAKLRDLAQSMMIGMKSDTLHAQTALSAIARMLSRRGVTHMGVLLKKVLRIWQTPNTTSVNLPRLY